MSTETVLLETSTGSAAAETAEFDFGPAEFVEAFRDISNLQRHALASVLHTLPGHLSAGNLHKHLGQTNPAEALKKIDYFVNSEQMRQHISLCLENGNYPTLLNNGNNREYIAGLARIGFIGGLVDGLLDGGAIPQYDKRLYRERLIESNHAFRELVESDFGQEMGLKRRHLKSIIGEAYGVNYDERSAQLTEKVEMGIAAEVATKRYIEATGHSRGFHVRYATPEEDSRKIDLVCSHEQKSVGVDVKSGDKHSPKGEERAWYSPFEEYDIHEYRVREMYPAKESCIGDDFDIRAVAYKRVIDGMLDTLKQLP